LEGSWQCNVGGVRQSRSFACAGRSPSRQVSQSRKKKRIKNLLWHPRKPRKPINSQISKVPAEVDLVGADLGEAVQGRADPVIEVRIEVRVIADLVDRAVRKVARIGMIESLPWSGS
jgi:hypothetical protein